MSGFYDPLYLSEEEIKDISDLNEGFEMLMERDLFLNYTNDLDDVKEILTLKYHSKPETSQNTKDKKIYENYPAVRIKLIELLFALKTNIGGTSFKKEIGEVFKASESQIESKMEELEKMIKRDKFPILIAGEAKAGKSSFINLLLGDDILPVGIVTCTRIICEIRNSEKRTVTFKGRGKPEIEKTLSGEEAEEISQIIRQEIYPDYTEAIYEYPVKFLDNHTYLVDSPGIGDTSALENMTFDYLKNCAPAFIFVLNATNCSGLNIKAHELIEKAKTDLAKEAEKYITDLTDMNKIKEYYFQYHKAIFILNHWDTIKKNAASKEEVEKVRQIIISEIKRLWHDSVNENEQIFFISALQANEWQKNNIVQNEIINIRNCIQKLIVNLYQKNILNSLQLFNIILYNMERKILQKINTTVDKKYCRLYDKKHAEWLCEILESISKEMEQRKSKIRDQLKPKFDTMANALTKHLKSVEVEDRILEISKKKITIHENMELTNIVLKKILETTIYEEIRIWEEKNKQMENLYSFLNSLFEDNLNEISDEIKISNTLINKESLIKAWNMSNHVEISDIDKSFISKIETVFIISTITLLFPVVALAGLLATPLIVNHMFKEQKMNEKKLVEYKSNPDEYIKNLISTSLQKLSAREIEKNFFCNVKRKCEDHIKSFETFLTVEINEKRRLIMDIENEDRETPDILKLLCNLFRNIESCYGTYHSICNMYDFSKDSCLSVPCYHYEKLINSEKRETEILSRGKHGIVFKNFNYPSLVFKLYNNKFIEYNARFQMQEILLLVKAPSDGILRCQHICMLENDKKVLLVLDEVDCNLQTFLEENEYLIPGKQKRDTKPWKMACLFMLDISLQICQGLQHLHSYEPRMVHPDLRLDTILVRKINNSDKLEIFICDASSNLITQRYPRKSGKSSETKEIAFDMGGFTKANIFRLGQIFYKLSQFENRIEITQALLNPSQIDSTDSMNSMDSNDSIECNPEIDWENEKHLNVPKEYNDLIMECVSYEPENRPNIDKIIETLKNIHVT